MLALLLTLTIFYPQATDSTQLRITLLPEALWSPTFGFGTGIRITKPYVITPDDQIRLTLAPSQRRQWVELAYNRGTYRSQFTFDRNMARTFYGTGPASIPEHDLLWPLLTLNQRLYVHYPMGRRGIVFHAEFRHDYSLRPPSSLPSPYTRNVMLTWLLNHRAISSLAGTLMGYLDFRDTSAFPRKGFFSMLLVRALGQLPHTRFSFLQAGWAHYQFVSPTPSTAVAFRSLLVDTWPVGKAPVPFFLLPTLDYTLLPGYSRYRFAGNDLLVFSLEGRTIVKNLWDVWIISATLGVHAGNTYDSWIQQALPWPSWKIHVSPDRNRYPLHMGMSLGLRIFSRRPERILMNAVWGISPENLSFAILSFVYHPGERITLPF